MTEAIKICKLCSTQSIYSVLSVNSPSQINNNSTTPTILNILIKHIDIEFEPTNVVCLGCWNKVHEFHLFYLSVKQVQKISIGKHLLIIREKVLENNDTTIEPKQISDIIVDLTNASKNTDDIDDPVVESEDSLDYIKTVNEVNKPLIKTKQNNENKEIACIKNRQKTINDKFISKHHPQINCAYCNDIFTKFSEYEEHCLDVHKKKECIISCCNLKMKKIFDIFEHLKVHENPDVFKCLTCNKQCMSKRILKSHTKVAHMEKPVNCDICGKIFKNKHILAYHMITVHSTNKNYQFVCECGKKDRTKSLLSAHRVSSHLQIICDICGKVENGKSSLRMHMLTFHTEKPPRIQYTICKSWQRNSYALKLHIKNHHTISETPFKCPKCEKTFTKFLGLQGHISYHKRRNKFPCHLCTKSFISTKRLNEHVATHTGMDLYTCDYCPRTFKASNNIITHKKARHASEYAEEKQKRANALLFDEKNK